VTAAGRAPASSASTTWAEEATARAWAAGDDLHDLLDLPRRLAVSVASADLGEISSVVDIGSGPGDFLAVALERSASARGLWTDVSPAMEILARTRLGGFGNRVQFVLTDLADMRRAVPAGSADLLVSSRVTHHLGQSMTANRQQTVESISKLNERLAVIDGDTGKIKRWWGAYGKKPDDGELAPYNAAAAPAEQYRSPVHCVALAEDGLLYVCDRVNDRIQIFHTDGKFVSEHFFAKNTLASGSTWEIAFSRDPAQRFIYLTDGQNERVRIVERASMKELTAFGRGGRQPSEFFGVHSIAVDSKGNIYTTETYEGKRVQKFIYKGISSVARGYQGVPWPKR